MVRIVPRSAPLACPLPVVVGAGGAPQVPAWFAAMDDKTWATPVSNTIEDVLPSPPASGDPAAICTAWTGGTVYQALGEINLLANGGHGDYAGNEGYACGLLVESPAWIRLSDPSTQSGGSDAQNSSGQWGDGHMRPVHGWNRCVCDASGKIWYASLDGMTTSGNWSTATHSFDRASLGSGPFPVSAAEAPYTYHGLGIADISGGAYNGEAGVSVYDRNRNWVWSLGGSGGETGAGYTGFTVDCATGDRTPRAMPGGGGRWGAHIWDLTPDLWIIGDPYPTNLELCILDCTNPTAGFTRKTTTGDTFPGDGAGCVYHQPSRALICWDDNGADIKLIRIPADPFNDAWVVEDISPAGSNVITPSAAAGNGTFSRFNIIEDMGNGQSALTLVNKIDEPVYVYKLPIGGLGAEEDWQSRVSAEGVQWAHDFRSATEFTKFAHMNDSQPDEWLQCHTSGGIGNGGYLEFSVPEGEHCNHSWPRPFSAFPGDVGYVSGSDYGSTDDWYKWRQGFYGHSDYHAADPTAFVGTDYYIQFRVKFSTDFFDSGNPGGKLAYIDIAGGGNQEIIATAPGQLFSMYTNFGRDVSNPLGQPQGDRTAYDPPYDFTIMQPGGAYNDTCTYDSYSPSTCWAYPVDEWVTVLIHVIPGHHNGDNIDPDPSDVYGDTGQKDTGIEVWVARAGETTYTKIWEKLDYAWNFDATSPAYGNQFGFNVFIFSAYKNNVPAAVDWNVKLGQIIFSTQPIACPKY